jgi:long-chain fatty acid transport protein
MSAGRVTIALLICSFFLVPTYGSAPFHGSKAAGMNTAFTAVADDPSAIAHNPAGIAQLEGTLVYAGGTGLIPSSTYDGPGGESVDTQFQTFFIPHLFVTHRLHQDGMTVGMGVFAPFGVGGRKWPADGPTRYGSIEGAIGTVAFNPTLAIKVHPSLSVAIGLDYMLARNDAKSAVDQSAAGASDARTHIKTDGDGWGYNLGLLYRPNDSWSIGLAYRSAIRVDQTGTFEMRNIAPAAQPLFGGASFQTSASGKMKFPKSVDLGIAYRQTQRWIIDVDAEWDGWSSFQRAELDLATEVPAAGLTDISVPQNWHDTWAYKIGEDYQVSDQLFLRAGYAFISTPVPESTLSPADPDADQQNFSLGVGWHANQWTLDGYYNYGIFKKRQVNNTILSGRYHNHAHYLGLSVGYRI